MAKNSLARQVRRAYQQDALSRICTLHENQFGRTYGMQTVTVKDRWRDKNDSYYYFKDNGANVLAVAHLDTVVRSSKRTTAFHKTEKGPLLISGALDDRLGAYVILELLPKMGVTCDWLLTVGEESGQSTAELFQSGKKYDWIIEFDRTGTDVVMYQYEDKPSRLAVEASGARFGQGSFSDIAYLEHLGVKAFNWGVGYRGDYHSVNGYAYLTDTFAMVAKYMRFHAQNAGTAMPHEKLAVDLDYDWYSDYLERNSDGRPDWDCLYCDGVKTVDECTMICSACRRCMDCGDSELDCFCFIPGASSEPARDSDAHAEGQRRIDAITAETSMFNAGVIAGQLIQPDSTKIPF